jgi:DNA-damage-inducible protein J
MSTTAISIRLDSDIKEQFDNLCKEFGISTSAAFNLFARAVVRERAIPFPISLSSKNSESDKRSLAAQKALAHVQALSALEEHEWTDEEIDELIASYRLKKNKP